MDGDTKVCPVCGETIKAIALKCRFCNSDLQAFAATKELETEKELFAGHPAIIYSVWQFVPFLAALVIAFTVGYVVESSLNILFAFLSFVLLFCVICLHFYLKSRRIRYQITTQRIKLERGLLSKILESLELFRIDHFELRKPLGMRLLSQASLHLFTSDAEIENFSIYGVPNLESLADTLRDCQLRERTRRNLTTFVKA